uniref:Uncharacterized protein n=1 Tax=Rhizophora mucronata TaxID=61149 RepID=A0A2P2PYA7_RHIMU
MKQREIINRPTTKHNKKQQATTALKLNELF